MINEKITIEDVATRAGVSVATVSRVMNGIQKVREETRQRVLDAMEALSYSPNASARNLRRQESNTILVMTPNLTNPFYTHILSGISDNANEMGYSSLIVPYESGENDLYQKLQELLDSKKADGAILLASTLDDRWLKKYESEYSLVQCAEYSTVPNTVPHVSIDNYQAMYDMTKYVQSMGHKHIALVINDNRYVSTHLRVKGFCDAMQEGNNGLNIDEYIYRGRDYGFDTGVDAARKLNSLDKRPTAILCASDILALGVIRGASEIGMSVPDDLSVTGFDDVDYTKMFHPYLTTLKQPCYELGRKSMELLYNSLNSGTVEREVYLPYEIKKRESVKPLM